MSEPCLRNVSSASQRVRPYLRDVGHVIQGIAVGTLIVGLINYPAQLNRGDVILFWASIIVGTSLVSLSSKF
jgi:hypothetical protein